MAKLKTKPKFKRTDAVKYSKLGVRRKKKQIYRKARGRDNKIRLNMKGHTRNVRIGFKNENAQRGLINGMEVVMISNINDLKKINKGTIGIVAKIGTKKKKEIVEYAKKEKIELTNVDIEKFLAKIEEKMEKSREEKGKRKKRKTDRDKKAKEKEEKEKKEAEKKDKEDSEGKKSEKEDVKKDDGTKGGADKEKGVEVKDVKVKKEIQTNNYGRGK